MDETRNNAGASREELTQVPEAPATNDTPDIVFGATQGKKGHKAPRINMAFSPANHKWIKSRSRQLGISATALVNTVIDHEREKDVQYFKVCRIRCRCCGDVLEYINQSKTEHGRLMLCSCRKVGLDPAASMYRTLGNPEDVEDLSEEWPEE